MSDRLEAASGVHVVGWAHVRPPTSPGIAAIRLPARIATPMSSRCGHDDHPRSFSAQQPPVVASRTSMEDIEDGCFAYRAFLQAARKAPLVLGPVEGLRKPKAHDGPAQGIRKALLSSAPPTRGAHDESLDRPSRLTRLAVARYHARRVSRRPNQALTSPVGACVLGKNRFDRGGNPPVTWGIICLSRPVRGSWPVIGGSLKSPIVPIVPSWTLQLQRKV